MCQWLKSLCADELGCVLRLRRSALEMQFVERKRSRKSQSFKLVNDAGKPMTADNRLYVSTLECTYRCLIVLLAPLRSVRIIRCVWSFVVKAFSSAGAFSLSMCTSSSVMEYNTGLSAAWTWWRSSQSRSLQVVLTCSITSSHLHRTHTAESQHVKQRPHLELFKTRS